MVLARELELADADLPDSPTPLLEEHMYAVTALEAMKHSQLGAILWPLDNYIGAWLFRGDRKQVWTGVEDAKTGSVVLYEQHNAICGPVQKIWTVRFNSARGRYVGTLKTTFKREAHETAILGEWDQEALTMTWTLESDALENARYGTTSLMISSSLQRFERGTIPMAQVGLNSEYFLRLRDEA